jgi:urocanate hydratase
VLLRAIRGLTEPRDGGDAGRQRCHRRLAATGTRDKAERLQRVLTNDPAMGLFRHADAGYERAAEVARDRGAKIPE